MGRLPAGWKKLSSSAAVESYAKKNYIIYLWKYPKEKKFIVEPFRKLANYKRRLFFKQFQKFSEARSFMVKLMSQKEIRGYYIKEDNV